MIKRYKHRVLYSVIDAVLYDGSLTCIDGIVDMLRTSIGVNDTEFGLFLQNPKWGMTTKVDKGNFVCKHVQNNIPFVVPGNKMLGMYEEVTS